MKLLILSNNLNRAGYRQRIEIYLDILKENAIQCKVAQLPSNYLSRWKLFKRARDFDAVLLHKKGLNPLDAFCLRRYSKKIIYHFDDAIMYSPKNPESHSSPHFRSFRRSVKLADTVIAASSYLAKHALKFNPNVIVLPTGIKISDYQSDCPHENDGKIRLVWIGSESTLSYLEQLKPVFEEIGSRYDNVILRIIGDDFFDLQNMEVEKRKWSKETRAFDLATADIGLAPLPDNRFTRGKCSFKVLEYSSAGLPVIASPVGTNPDHIIDGNTGFLADNATQWIDKIVRLIENPDLRKQMADAAKAQAAKFDSDIIGKKLTELIGGFIKENTNIASAIGTPKVSICIPTYNRKEYLKETINSILDQTYKNYEIVIVDDGSTDGTEEMIKNLDFPITYCWQENGGDAAARNKLIELATGKYISFLDSDDLLIPDAIERMVNVMKNHGRDVVVYGSYFRIDQNGKIYGRCRRKLHSGNITKYLFQTIMIHSCGSMFPAKILKSPMIFDSSLKTCSDYDLWLRLSLKYHFIALAEPTFKRRRHAGNLSHVSFENCLTEFKVLDKFYREKGGDKEVPENIARKVFSKEIRRTGRYALKENLHEQAERLLSESFKQYPNLKTIFYWSRAVMAKKITHLCHNRQKSK